ncbi:hypothetical protein ARMGADRAFT_1083898 [Armillaria gallica]|uniref:Uncharacterized protein n=1 Tax=Armillaria gallica TaxID=47427 RepID=A0A2H3DMA8_ARMGA|nr:hypothetical protein ARMGADRAFT_1083898 [Armillaria gallica]
MYGFRTPYRGKVLLPDVQLSRDYKSCLHVTLSQDFNVGAEDCDYQDSSDDVLNEARWNDGSYSNGILGLDITWSRLLQMSKVRSGGDLFYDAQYMALQRDLVYWRLWNDANRLKTANNNLRFALSPEHVALMPCFPTEIESLFVAACVRSPGVLANIWLVCHAWNDEVVYKHNFFHCLIFRNRRLRPRACRRDEYWLCSSLVALGITNTIMSITLRNWTMDSRCWFLRTLSSVTDMKIINCGVWPWLYCLPNTVIRLLVRETEIRVSPGLYRLCDVASQISSLTLDRVTVPFMVMDSEGDAGLAVTWRADHGLINMLIPPVPAYSACLSELTIYNDSDNSMDQIINNLVSPLEDLLSDSDVDLTWPRRWNGCEVSKLWLGFGDVVHVRLDAWDAWGLTVQDLTLSLTGYEDNYPLSIEGFMNLEALRFEVDLDSKSTQWILDVTRSWSYGAKTTFELVLYEEHALTSTGEHRCTLNIFDSEESCWIECDSWQIWWECFTDSLLEAFSPSHTNHASRFHGELVITFVTPEVLTEAPSASSHFAYARRLLNAYEKRLKWLKLGCQRTVIRLLSFENYREVFEVVS